MRRFLQKLFKRKSKDPFAHEKPYLIYKYFDVRKQEEVIIELVCSCGWPISGFKKEDDGFWCGHCDRTCPEGLPTCEYCEALAQSDAEAIRARYEAMQDDEDED